jgi:hypothetical protein
MELAAGSPDNTGPDSFLEGDRDRAQESILAER